MKYIHFLKILLVSLMIIESEAFGQWANHVVISELQVAGTKAEDEFIELYNPTSVPVELSSWSLQYRGGDAKTYQKQKLQSTITPYGYYLVANNNAEDALHQRADLVTSSISLSRTGGTVYLVSNNTLLTSQSDTAAGVVDRIAYGTGDSLRPEIEAAPSPPASQSIERKPGDVSNLHGNGFDSHCNAYDFDLRAIPDPQGISSMVESPDGTGITTIFPDICQASQPSLTLMLSIRDSSPWIGIGEIRCTIPASWQWSGRSDDVRMTVNNHECIVTSISVWGRGVY